MRFQTKEQIQIDRSAKNDNPACTPVCNQCESAASLKNAENEVAEVSESEKQEQDDQLLGDRNQHRSPIFG
jgi:hypothetical protein